MITSITDRPVTVGVSEPRVGIPINEWWGIQSELGSESSWQAAYNRSVDRVLDLFPKYFGETRRLGVAEANELYGVPGILKFEKDIDERDALYQSDKARRDYLTQEILNNAKHQSGVWRGVSGVAANIFGQMFNSQYGANIDFGINTFPWFGVGSKAARIARAAKYEVQTTVAEAAAAKAGRVTFMEGAQAFRTATGLSEIYKRGGLIGIDQARLGILSKAPNLTESIITGTASTAVGELTNFLDSQYQDKETHYWETVATDSAAIIPFHLTMRAIGKGIGKAAELYGKMSREGADIASTKAATRAITGDESIDPSAESQMDPNLLEEKASATQVETDLANAESTRVRIRTNEESPVAGPNELLYLLDAEVARHAGTERGTMLQELLNRFYDGDRSLKFFREVAALMDKAYDPRAIHPQEAVFIERFFTKEKADAFARVNKSIQEITPWINLIDEALAELSSRTAKIGESGTLPKLTKEINDIRTKIGNANKEKARLAALRDKLRKLDTEISDEEFELVDQLLVLESEKKSKVEGLRGYYNKKINAIRERLNRIREAGKLPEVYQLTKKIDDVERGLADASKTIAELEARLKELEKKVPSATVSHKQELDKLRIQRRKLEKELYAFKEARKKYGGGIDAPAPLMESEISKQLEEAALARDLDAELRGRQHLAPTHVINADNRIAKAQKAIADVRAKRAEAKARFEKAVAENDLEKVVAAIDEIKGIDNSERVLMNQWRLLVSEIDVAEYAGKLKEISKKRNSMLSELKKAQDAGDFEKVSQIKKDIIELDVETRAVKAQAESARGVRNSIEIEDEIFTYKQLIDDLETRANEAADGGNKKLSDDLNAKAKAAKAELQKLQEKVNKEASKKSKAAPVTVAEKSKHAQQRSETLVPIVQKEREAAVKRYAEKESPKAKAEKEADDAAKVAADLSKRRANPAQDPFKMSEGDPAKAAQVDDADAEATIADLRSQVETLRKNATPVEGKPQTPSQKLLETRANQIEQLLLEAERELGIETQRLNSIEDGQKAAINCMIQRNSID